MRKKSKIIIGFVVGILFIIIYYMYYYNEQTYSVNCIGVIENKDLTDDVGFGYWRLSKERAIEYLYTINSTNSFQEIENIAKKIQMLNSDERVLVSVVSEIKYIKVEDDMGVPRTGPVKLGTKKVYFYTTEYEGQLLPR